jgi:predicted CoA-binding protein
MPIVDDITGLRRILAKSHTLAVVGLSAQWYRPSFFAAKYMRDHGYRIIPVNPRYDEVLGERCYPDLRSIPEPVDLVDCFRKSADIPPIAEDAIAIGARVLWMQLGVINEEAAQRASAAGLDVVMNRCVKIEHARILGGLNWAGVNTGVISARRPVVIESRPQPLTAETVRATLEQAPSERETRAIDIRRAEAGDRPS